MKKLLLNKKFQLPIVLFLAGSIIMLSADAIFKKENNTAGSPDPAVSQTQAISTGANNSSQTQNDEASKKELEAQITNLIEKINGVNEASVVITYENSGEAVTSKDSNKSNSSTKENDGSGGQREITEESSSDQTVYSQGSDGSKNPFVISEKNPAIRGVAVVLKGNYNETTKQNIINLLGVLLNLPIHKIQVIW